jgi:glycosyltransferase involved in cell wall biosynthesis
VGTMRLVIAAGGFPPPVTGQSKNLDLIAADIAALPGVHLVKRSLAMGTLRKTLAAHLRKASRVLYCLATIIVLSPFYRSRSLYLVSDGDRGQIYTVSLAWLARALGYTIILQHRTFNYAHAYSKLAKIVDGAVAGRGFHIFLCECMAVKYKKLYQSNTSHIVVGNLSQYQSQLRETAPVKTPSDIVKIGMLSNLFLEKGLDTFLRVAAMAKEQGLPAHFILAGPAPNDEARALIDEHAAMFGSSLEYLGPVHGAEKAAFYDRLDIFLFPTRFKLEAQPNVVLEAMCAACAVVSVDRGCIAEDVGEDDAIVAADAEGDAVAYYERVERLVLDRSRLDRARIGAFNRSQVGIRRDRDNYSRFLSALQSGELGDPQ